MRYLVSGKEMKLLDQNTSQVFHVPELVLMEQASMAFVQKLLLLKQNKLSTALIACGSGNNGGDGLAIARLLREQGILYSYGWQERKKGIGPVRPMMFKTDLQCLFHSGCTEGEGFRRGGIL